MTPEQYAEYLELSQKLEKLPITELKDTDPALDPKSDPKPLATQSDIKSLESPAHVKDPKPVLKDQISPSK